MRFGKKGKLSPKYVGPYNIIRRIGRVAYELDLPSKLGAVHPVFHVSMLRKCIGDPSRITPIEDIHIAEDLSYAEVPVAILDRQVGNMIPVSYRERPPLLAFGWVQVRTLIDPSARISGFSYELMARICASLFTDQQPEPLAASPTRGRGQGRGLARGRCRGRAQPRAAAPTAEPQ
uniref:Uncharacterized protein LOC104227932 n=1 Tax=Nicotiana sylvestris TaxID=4096 RepID=A0A1U7WVA1_NICSY